MMAPMTRATAKHPVRKYKSIGLAAVRPMVEDEKADEKDNGQTSRKEIEIHCGLATAFDFLNDDGAQEQRKSDAPCNKVEIHGYSSETT